MLTTILLKVTLAQNLLVIFFPTILMLASIPFWFVKKIPNSAFYIYSSLVFFGLAILLLILSGTSDDLQSPGWLGGIFILIILLVCNSYQYIVYLRKLNTKRCPHCHSVGMQTLNKDIETKIKRYITTYKARGGRYDGKEYDKIDEAIRKRIMYTLYCPSCGNICNWEEEKEEYLVRDGRPKS